MRRRDQLVLELVSTRLFGGTALSWHFMQTQLTIWGSRRPPRLYDSPAAGPIVIRCSCRLFLTTAKPKGDGKRSTAVAIKDDHGRHSCVAVMSSTRALSMRMPPEVVDQHPITNDGTIEASAQVCGEARSCIDRRPTLKRLSTKSAMLMPWRQSQAKSHETQYVLQINDRSPALLYASTPAPGRSGAIPRHCITI